MKKLYNFLLVFLFLLMSTSVSADYILPTSPYLSFNDSPFSVINFDAFYLEDFEDHLLDLLGVTHSGGGVTSLFFGERFHDSVDFDDGLLDGSGLNGDSFYYGSGSSGITFWFDKKILGGLPTYAGLVWTDGMGQIMFEAFNSKGNSLGVITGEHSDGSVAGTTDEDRFYGVTNPDGISAIKISNKEGGIEIDHLQFAMNAINPVPEPATIFLLGLGIVGFATIKKRRNV